MMMSLNPIKMVNYNVFRYSEEYFEQWNLFIYEAKNATFLFDRNFMDYHADKFQDFSLMIYDDKKIIAVLPANNVDQNLYSHQGLTYGGLVYKDDLKFDKIIKIYYNVLEFLKNNGIISVFFKSLPSVYASTPNGELDYLLFLSKAKLFKSEILSVINLQKNFTISKNRKQGYNRGKKNNFEIKEGNFDLFWTEILKPNLKNKYKSAPVHTLKEISLLHQQFPSKIKQINVYHNAKIVAGATLFIDKNVVRTQYISSNTDSNKLGSLDFLFYYLIKEKFKTKQYFDFGSSNLNNGTQINSGLLYWKESFGARAIIHNFFEVKTENFKLIKNIMV